MIKKYLVSLLFISLFYNVFSQSEDCAGATLITNGNCYNGTVGLTQSFSGCVGTADDDVWYKFVASSSSHSITVNGSASFDAVFQVFSGNCNGLVSLSCIDNSFSGQTESGIIGGLTSGNTYFIRVYHYYAGSGSSTFTLCLNNPPLAPTNNNCSTATSLTVNGGCVDVNGSSFGATQSQPGCVGNANDDVWYTFTATNYTQTIQVTGSATMDAVVEFFNGTCGGLVSSICMDNSFSGGTEVITASGLTPNNIYYFRVYDYYSGTGSSFSVCVSGTTIISNTQPNDEPCNAIQIPAVTADCNNLIFSNEYATPTSNPAEPTAICQNYDNSTNTYGAVSTGGFNTASTADVWFKIIVPASGNIYITPLPNMAAGWVQDGSMALYTGACNALTTYTCSDDYNYPGGYNDLQPFLRATGLTPGDVVYLRYWGYGSATGQFGFCATSPTNDFCANALYICDINGFSATTSPAYTRDHPCNMRANGESAGPAYSYSVGANPAGPFGAGGTWGAGSALNDVYIDNNSWIRFTASSPTVSLRVTVDNCWGVGLNSNTSTLGTPRGIQMQIFSTSAACCGFVPVSDYKENLSTSFTGGVSTFTINANSLTLGQDYYVMVDGWSGDICNYNIQAIAGVAFPKITALPDSICPGESTVLTAPLGATGYTWQPTGPPSVNTRTLSVSPGTTLTYTCYVGGVCGYKQTLTKTVYVKTVPTVEINSGNAISNCGTAATVLGGSGANTYTWNTGPTTTSITVSPTVTTTYSLTGKASNGCMSDAISTITVNPIPTFTISSSNTNTICSGQSTTLSVSGTATSYTWSPGGTISNSITVSPSSTTVYNVTGKNAQGCSAVIPTTITVNTLPTVSSSSVTICNGNTATLTASGASTYSWSTSASSSATAISPTVTTTYTVIGTAANTCTNLAYGKVTVNVLPTITVNSPTICMSQSVTLTANGGNTYTWSTTQNGSSVSVSPTVTTTYSVIGTALTTCTNITIATVTVLSLPQLTSTPSISSSNCSASTGSITNVTVNGSPALSYTWTNSLATNVGTNPSLNNQPAGTYNLLVKDGNGCLNNFGPYSITNPGAPVAPTVSVSANSICVGQTIDLFTNGTGGTYNWSGPNSYTSTTQNPSITNATVLETGLYSVFETLAGCSGPAASISVTVNSLPTPNAVTNQTLYCVGNTLDLSGSSASSYTWSGPGSFSSNAQSPSITSVSVSSAGVYTLYVTNASSCVSSTTVDVKVYLNPVVTASVNALTYCAGDNILFNANGGGNYNWVGPNGFSDNAQSPTITNSGLPNSGSYTVTVTDANNCSTLATVSLSVASLPTFTISANNLAICYGSPIQLNAGSGAYTYNWNGSNSFSVSNNPNPQITNTTPSNSGTYTVTAVLASCSASQTIAINVYPQININASANSQIVCNGSSVNLLGTGGGNYAWSGPNNFVSSNQNPQITNAQSLASGVYTLIVTDNITNCSVSDTVTVLISPAPSFVNSSNDSTCVGGILSLYADFGPNVTVNWYSDAALTNLVQANANTYMPNLISNGTYTYYVQGVVGNCVSSVQVVTGFYYNILAIASADVYTGYSPLSVNLTGSNSQGVTLTDSFLWNFGDNTTTSSLPNPSHVFTSEGTYTVVLLVTDIESGCLDTTSVTIKVEDDIIVEVPNVFTPNGDGANDVFKIKIRGVSSAEGFIYNRWGQLLYSWDVLNIAWDGKASNGENCPDGTYYYLIKVVDKKNKEHLFPGHVMIIR